MTVAKRLSILIWIRESFQRKPPRVEAWIASIILNLCDWPTYLVGCFFDLLHRTPHEAAGRGPRV